MKRQLLAVLTALVVGALAACSPAGTPTASESTSTPTASPTVTPTPTPTPTVYAPLTGRKVRPRSIEHPALMAKIDNHPEARPQVGLNHADIVFEELVEGGLTRYVAVWHSNIPKEIGPIRSIRPMDPDIASAFKGIITYSGGQYRFVQMMIHTRVKNVIHGMAGTEKYIFRSTARIAPHDVIVRARKLVQDYKRLRKPGRAFVFARDPKLPTAVEFGQRRGLLVTSFSSLNTPTWRWNPNAENYRRFQAGGEKDTDERRKQLSATNVIVQMTNESNEFGYVPRAHVIGRGTAYISTGGKTVKGVWIKRNRNAFTEYRVKGAGKVTLAPGRTWIELVPTTTGYFRAERK